MAELLARQPLPAEAQSHVQTIVDSAAATLRLLEDAIDLARAEAGELSVTPAPTALQPLVDGLQDQWQARARQADVNLMLSYEGDTELAAEIDGDRLARVIDNLVANAVARSRHGVVEASLKAVAEDHAVRIAVSVRDDSADTDRSDLGLESPDAAGLSVAISRRLVADLGGVLTASANQGRGAAFAFSLTAPRAQIAAEPAVNVSELAALQIEQTPHILIVDDNATNRVVAQALCEMFGCSCETAEDGVEAVEAVLTRPFDMVLMDIKMPRMDGLAATAAIRALAGDAGTTPIVALTANADPDDAARYIEAGMCGVVEKPIKPERLRLAMNTALSQPRDQAAPVSASAVRVA